MVPRKADLENADAAVKRFHELVGRNSSSSLAKDLHQLLLHAAPEKSRFTEAFPRTIQAIEQCLNDGVARSKVPHILRSIEWLEEHGCCLDHIRPGRSSLRQAGQGAFATRKIKQGQVIAPMPVLHILRSELELYTSEPEYQLMGHQILLNYGYGHPDSSIILLPYAPYVNYVNHNVTMCNAELRWSLLATHKDGWMQRAPADLALNEEHVGLVMEMVASRDISPGGEIFINYGESWEQSWTRHLQEWMPTSSVYAYSSAAELNQKVEWIKTENELRHAPHNGNVSTYCQVNDPQTATRMGMSELYEGVPKLLWQYDHSVFVGTAFALECSIIDRTAGDVDDAYDRSDSIRPMNVRYTALLYASQDAGYVEFHNVPREAIRFVDKKQASDLFLKTAFRHEILLPEEMVPPAWRDLKHRA